MLTIDFSGITSASLSALMSQTRGSKRPTEIPIGLLRHMILNSIRRIRVEYPAKEWGELVLACDSSNYWRTSLFPYYKASRRRKREGDPVFWNAVYSAFDQIQEEIKECRYYTVVRVPHCEADDIIAVLARVVHEDEAVMVVSRDEDLLQLLIYKNVRQYDPIGKRELTVMDPIRAAQEFFLRGDPGDGVPNVLSNDRCFVDGVRQTPLTSAVVQKIITDGFRSDDPATQLRIDRNLALLDLRRIPQEHTTQIVKEYWAQTNKTKNRDSLLAYFRSKELRKLSEQIDDF